MAAVVHVLKSFPASHRNRADTVTNGRRILTTFLEGRMGTKV
jgi:hypothetical protein